jgi:hypothetical protein
VSLMSACASVTIRHPILGYPETIDSAQTPLREVSRHQGTQNDQAPIPGWRKALFDAEFVEHPVCVVVP